MVKIHKFLIKHTKGVSQQILREMLQLATSGLGLVAALAWNELIRELVNEYIRPFVGGSSAVISLFIYAVIITALAVFVTYNLSRLIKRS